MFCLVHERTSTSTAEIRFELSFVQFKQTIGRSLLLIDLENDLQSFPLLGLRPKFFSQKFSKYSCYRILQQ